MTVYSYHISHEQFAPSELLKLVQQAEAAGFEAAFSSDHLQPWSSEQGHSGFAWSWLGAALQATKRLTFGVITVPGNWRYHPVVLAQAVATLGEMFPNRLPWIAVGSGEAINERVTGRVWPDKAERNERTREGVEIMRRLLRGETVTHRGRVRTINAKVWSRPEQPTQIVGAATSEATAEWLGSWADGLLTAGSSSQTVRPLIEAFKRGGGEGKPIHLKVDLSFASTEAEALTNAHSQWRFNVLGGDANWELSSPAHFDQATRFIRPEDMRSSVLISSEPDQFVEWLRGLARLGVSSMDLHNVGPNQSEFIEIFGREVLPRLQS
ncbi:MAG: TIGR03885 family FMN-dependent LLM class oxidoreductase [Povalibacter sp.]